MKSNSLENVINDLYEKGLIDDEVQERLNDDFNTKLERENERLWKLLHSMPFNAFL